MFFRVIGQYLETTRDPVLWTFAVPEKERQFSGSALFAYKLNWQTVAVSATATTARWTRAAASCARTGSSSSRSPTRFSD